jgi:hypothetical protein
MFMQANPDAFALANGAWGLRGSTLVRLSKADADTVRKAMKAAWLGRAPKVMIERFRKSSV